jgi:hypothetical protein
VRDKLKERGITLSDKTDLDVLYQLYAVAANTGATNWNTLIQEAKNVNPADLPKEKNK